MAKLKNVYGVTIITVFLSSWASSPVNSIYTLIMSRSLKLVGSFFIISAFSIAQIPPTTMQISVLKIPAIQKNNHNGPILENLTVSVVRSRWPKNIDRNAFDYDDLESLNVSQLTWILRHTKLTKCNRNFICFLTNHNILIPDEFETVARWWQELSF